MACQNFRTTSDINLPQRIDDFEKSMKPKKYNQRSHIKLILGYYNKHTQFSKTIDEEWRRHLSQLETFCGEYGTETIITFVNLAYLQKPSIKAYYFYKN